MASDERIAEVMDFHLRAKGYVCGRNFQASEEIAREIRAQLVGEDSVRLLESKILRIARARTYEFKTDGERVSASKTADPDCGT